MTKGERAAKHVDLHRRLMNALTGVLVEARAKQGQECWRHDYDIALHMRVAIQQAGLKVVNQPKGEAK